MNGLIGVIIECRPNDTTTTSSSSSTPLKEINGPAQDSSASPAKKSDDNKSTPPTPKKLKPSTKLKTPNKSIPTKTKVPGSSPKKAVTAPNNVEQLNVSSPNKSPPQQQPVVTNACLLPNGTMIPLMTNSPITAVFTEPPKSTTATMLPLQTIFVTSNVMQNVHQPVITRIALGQNHSFMSSGLEANSIPGFVHKIPITMIRKPVPKIKFKRRHKKKILQAETVTPAVDSVISVENSTKDNAVIPSVEVEETTPMVEIQEKEKSSSEKEIAESEATANKNVQNSEPVMEKVVESETMTPSTTTIIQPNLPLMEKSCSTNSSELMQIQLFAHEPDQEIMEVDQSTSLVDAPSPASVLCELKSRTEQSDSAECSDKSNENLNEPPTIDGKISNTASHENISHEINKEDSSVSTTDISTSHKVTSKVRFDQALVDMNRDPSPTNHQETISPPNETVSGDKISECISRSMDLIDAPDGELMELGDNWGDPTNSPKSPISPTQMFLSMFPLLPKDNVVSTSEGHNIMTNNPRHGYNSQTQHRSFYIDSMLPEDNSVPVSQIGQNNRHSAQTFGYRTLAMEAVEKPYSKPPKSTPEILTSSSTISKVSASNVQPVSAPMTVPQRSSEIITTKTTKPVVTEKPCEMPTTPKSLQESGSRRSHSYSGGQQSFKEFNIFSDSLDFSALHHSLPFSGMTDQDLFRGGENSRSRGLFDAVFPLNIDHSNAVPSSTADQHYNIQQHFDVQENIQNIQFQLNRDRHHGTIGGGESTARLENLPPVGESYSNNFTYPTIPRANLMSKLPSTSSQITSTSQHNNSAITSQGNSTSFSYSATISTPPKATAAKISPTTPSHSTRQLFRPQVHDMMGNHQSSSTANTTSTQPFGSKRSTASTIQSSIDKVANNSSQAPRNVDYFLFQKSSQQPPTTIKPSLSSSEKRKSSAASQRKSRNTTSTARDANSFEGPSNSSSTSRKERNQKDRSTSKETNKKSTASGAKQIPAPICEPIQNFNQFPPQNSHLQPNQTLQTSPRRNIATSSHTQDIFAPLPPTNLFGHSTSNQQAFDHNNVNLNIFAEFPLPVDCNPHYDHYSMDFSNFSTASGSNNSSQIQQFQQPQINSNPTTSTGTLHEPHNNIPHQQQHHHNQQQQQQPLITHPHNNTSQVQHTPSNSRSSRPTPFYLQDVNCDNYNSFEMPSNNPPSHSQQSHQMHTSSNPPPSANPQTQPAPSIHSGHHHYGNVPTVPPPRSQPPPQQTVSNLNHQNQQYFQTPLQQQSQAQQCQQQVSNYPTNNNLRQGQSAAPNQQINNNSNNNSTGVLPNSRNVQIQQQQAQNNSSTEHQQIMQHSHHYTHSSQTQVKPTKQSSSSIVTSSVVSNNNNNNNQSSLAQQQPVYSSTNTNARVLPPPNVTSSHRPVNWMTDNNQTASSTTPSHNPFTIGSNSKPNNNNTPTAITNPFSVSKLVGSSSSNSPSSIKPQPHPHTLSRQTSSSNYCAEALIRKNPITSSTPNLSSSTQPGWGSSSSSLHKTQHNYNFFQPSSSSSASSSANVHQFNAQHQTQTSQQHSNPYTTNFNDNFSSATSGYSFHTNPTPHSHPHAQNYEQLFENSTPSRNTHQQQQNVHNFQHPQTHQSHHIHHLHNNNSAQQGLSHSQQGTSSVSNFNLSTIFPEINDKRQHQVQQQRNSSIASSGTTGSLSNSTPVGVTSNNSQNRASTNSSGGSNNMANLARGTSSNNNNSNCGYYTQQQPTGQGRTK